jgi:hypothetical protein
MTTNVKVGVAADAFQTNSLIKLDRSAFDSTIALSVAEWISARKPYDVALVEVLKMIYRSMCERMSGYHVWLLLGNECWQDDTRIRRHKKLFQALKPQGLNFEAFQDRREFMVEKGGKLKFFGAVRLDDHALIDVPKTMQPGSCTYLLALPEIAPVLPESSGWSGALDEDIELIRTNIKNEGIIFQRVGYFDDPDVGFVALGKPDVIARLTAYS